MSFNIQLNLSRSNWKMMSVLLILTLALTFLFYWSSTEPQPMIVGGDEMHMDVSARLAIRMVRIYKAVRTALRTCQSKKI